VVFNAHEEPTMTRPLSFRRAALASALALPLAALLCRCARAVHERYALSVHDARGRPVPDAEVAVYAGSHALPLWARTDPAGRAWLHPLAAVPGLGASLLEVQVRDGKSGARGAALLQRGQKHQLQITLADGRRTPPRPQLDIASRRRRRFDGRRDR
jgi:hypothetical protein